MAGLSVLRRSSSKLRNLAVHLRGRARPDRTADFHWFFVATLPNSGSTALAHLLSSAPAAGMLTSNGEGSWLIPDLSDARRMDPLRYVNYDVLRSVWTTMAGARGAATKVIVDKSPANLCRIREILATFAMAPCTMVSFTRDPYAVCSSWAKRYPEMAMANAYLPEGNPEPPVSGAEDRRFWMLGTICGSRMRTMIGLRDVTDLTIRYEDLVVRPEDAIAHLTRACPLLAGISADAPVRVKDYEPQKLTDMNAAQIALLSPRQVEMITLGLRPFVEAVRSAGYELRDG